MRNIYIMRTDIAFEWKNYLILIIFVQLCVNLCFAQSTIVSGVVTSEGEELIGVNIIIKRKT